MEARDRIPRHLVPYMETHIQHTAHPGPPPRQAFRWVRSFVIGTVVIACAMIPWSVFGSHDPQHPGLLPAPTLVFNALRESWRAGTLQIDVLTSLGRVAVGFSAGAILGFVTGILYLNDRARQLLTPLVEVLRPIPPIAWIPLSILWFGYGSPPAFFLTSLGAFFPVLTATHSGFAGTEVAYTNAAISLGLSRRQVLRRITLPQALPSIISGARTGLGVAWMIVVTAELVGAQSGLGYMIQVSRAQTQPELVIGGMVLIGFVGLCLSAFLALVERVTTPWRFRHREVGLH